MGLFWTCSMRNVIPWTRLLTGGRARCSHKPVRQPAFKMLPQAVFPPLSSCVCAVLSHIRLIVTPWTVAHHAPLSMGFFRQECWSGFPFPPAGDLLDPGAKLASPLSPALQADSLYTEPSCPPDTHAGWVSLAPDSMWLFSLFKLDHLSFFLKMCCWGRSPCTLCQLSTLRLRTWEREASNVSVF